jgi:hypothetical protein
MGCLTIKLLRIAKRGVYVEESGSNSIPGLLRKPSDDVRPGCGARVVVLQVGKPKPFFCSFLSFHSSFRDYIQSQCRILPTRPKTMFVLAILAAVCLGALAQNIPVPNVYYFDQTVSLEHYWSLRCSQSRYSPHLTKLTCHTWRPVRVCPKIRAARPFQPANRATNIPPALPGCRHLL